MWSLTHTQPKCSAALMRIARPTSLVQTLDDEPVVDVVRPRERLLLVGEALHRDDRAEHLALHDLAVLRRVGDDRRLVEEAGPVDRVAADRDLGAGLDGPVDHARDPVELVGRDDRAHRGVLVERVAGDDLADRVGEPAHEVVEHARARR